MANLQKLAKAMESLETLKFEGESSKKKMQDLEQEQSCSADDEELNKQSDSHAESETKETLELDELTQGLAKEMSERLGEFNKKMADHKKMEETLKNTKVELETSKQNIASLENLLSSSNEALAKVTNQKEALDAVVSKLKTEAEEAKSQSAILEQLIDKERQQFFAEKVELTFTLDILEEEKNLLNQQLKDAIDKVNGLESSPKEFESHVKTIGQQHYKGIAAHESKLNDLQKTLAKAKEEVSLCTSIVKVMIAFALSVVFMVVVKLE